MLQPEQLTSGSCNYHNYHNYHNYRNYHNMTVYATEGRDNAHQRPQLLGHGRRDPQVPQPRLLRLATQLRPQRVQLPPARSTRSAVEACASARIPTGLPAVMKCSCAAVEDTADLAGRSVRVVNAMQRRHKRNLRDSTMSPAPVGVVSVAVERLQHWVRRQDVLRHEILQARQQRRGFW